MLFCVASKIPFVYLLRFASKIVRILISPAFKFVEKFCLLVYFRGLLLEGTECLKKLFWS